MGHRCRLAFHTEGLQAFGGYIEGFLPAPFGVEAVAADDKILAFLALSNADLELTAGAKSFELRRGAAVVKFEGTPDIPLPNLADMDAEAAGAVPVGLPDAPVIDALLNCVPKTGWGGVFVEMVGMVVDSDGVLATDNTSMAFSPQETGIPAGERMILPRPFLLALVHWVKVLGENLGIAVNDKAIYAQWDTGEILTGALPEAGDKAMDFSTLQNLCIDTTHHATPAGLAELLDEAAIFSESVLFAVADGVLQLSTAGGISWHRNVEWLGVANAKARAYPLKRVRAALDYTTRLAIGDSGKLHLSNPETPLYVVIASEG